MSTIDTTSGLFSTQSVASEAVSTVGLNGPASKHENADRREFESRDIRAFRSDDAMAGGMVGIILSAAFLVLLGLTTGVNIWMARFANC